MMNSYESEVAKVECLNAAASCLRAFSRSIPYLLMVVAAGYLMQSALDAPYTLMCKTVPAEKPARVVKYRAPMMSPKIEEPLEVAP